MPSDSGRHVGAEMNHNTHIDDKAEDRNIKRDNHTGLYFDFRQEFLENRLAELRKLISETEENNAKRSE